MQTVVINNKEALIIGQLPHIGKDTAGVPQIGEQVTFYPGVNLVDSKKLALLRKNPGFDAFFTEKIARSLAPEQNPEMVGKHYLVAGPQVEDKRPLEKLDPKAAEEVIEETLMAPLLRTWRKEEGRDSVKAAIDRQLDAIGASGKGGPAAVSQ